jgi:hypothetical protein
MMAKNGQEMRVVGGCAGTGYEMGRVTVIEVVSREGQKKH